MASISRALADPPPPADPTSQPAYTKAGGPATKPIHDIIAVKTRNPNPMSAADVAANITKLGDDNPNIRVAASSALAGAAFDCDVADEIRTAAANPGALRRQAR